MIEESLLHNLEKWGYFTLPRSHKESPGYSGLLVLMLTSSEHPYFKPVSLHLQLKELTGTVHWTTLDAKTPFPFSRVVCPGRVDLHNAEGECRAFFTYGGTIEAERMPGETVYSLRSEAPILVLDNQTGSVGKELAAETEALLASLHISMGISDQSFLERLVALRPFDLYTSVIAAIRRRFRATVALREMHPDLARVLRHEQRWLEEHGRWPEKVVPLADLVSQQ